MFSIVLVSYNSVEVLGEAIRSIPPGHQVIVVDNASQDGSAELARSLGATVLEMGENLGFGTACNRGAALALHERLLFLNPDATLNAGALPALGRAFDAYPDSIAFNPRILNADGTLFDRRRTILLPRPYWFRPPPPTTDCKIISASGAALLVRKSEFERLGGFDEAIFLYYEDDDLSARIIKSGRTMHLVHDAVVRHLFSKSSPDTPALSSFRDYQAMKSRIYVCRKHGIRPMRGMRIVEERIRRFLASRRGDARRAARAEARLRALMEDRG